MISPGAVSEVDEEREGTYFANSSFESVGKGGLTYNVLADIVLCRWRQNSIYFFVGIGCWSYAGRNKDTHDLGGRLLDILMCIRHFVTEG